MKIRQSAQESRRGVRGQAVIEFSLMAPWILFLFVGVFDWGFYSYAAICTQNAARTAALANAAAGGASSSNACTVVLQEMNSLPNTRSGTLGCTAGPCPATPGTVTHYATLAVTACAVSEVHGSSAVRLIVTSLSFPLIPIPGILMGQLTMTRAVDAPILNLVPVAT
jgi:Flp pilus assembly protein TadG